MSFLETLVLTALVTLLIAWPYLKEYLNDVNPIFLQRQSSIGPTREKGESAIYRSVDVPHGLPLTGGLRIKFDYRLRDGSLKDIWYLALYGTTGTKKDLSKTILSIGGKTLSIGQVNTLIHQAAKKLDKLTKCSKIGIYSDFTSLESILVTFSCFFISEKTLVNFNSFPKKPIEDLDLIVVDESNVSKVENLGFATIVVIGKTEGNSHTVSLDIDNNVEASSEYSYIPDKEYMKFNVQPYSEVNEFREVRFFQRSIVSSVSSRLMSLPKEFSWNGKDSVVITVKPTRDSKNGFLTNLLCGILSRVNRVTAVSDKSVENLDQLLSLDPSVTILATDDAELDGLVRHTDINILKKFLINRSEYLNSVGIFNTLGKARKLHLKLVYSLQTDQPLSSPEYNMLRSSLGSRIIREKYSSLTMGPVLKTNVYESRVFNGKMTELGVAANCVEIKTKGKEDKDTGELYARGYSIGKGVEGVDYDDDFWVSVGISGRFAKDGCFYASEK